jgi:hypothetical protein
MVHVPDCLGNAGIYLLEAWLTKGQQTVARATAKFIVPSQDIALAHR